MDSIINQVPSDKREEYKSKIIKKLEDYAFTGRKSTDSPHPESMLLRKGKIAWDDLNYENPEDVARAVITTLLPYYVAETQNRIKKYIIKNL